MGIANIIEWAQGIAWPEFLQPHAEVLLLWITWAVDYIDLDYLEVCFVLKLNKRSEISLLEAKLTSVFLSYHSIGYIHVVPHFWKFDRQLLC